MSSFPLSTLLGDRDSPETKGLALVVLMGAECIRLAFLGAYLERQPPPAVLSCSDLLDSWPFFHATMQATDQHSVA